MVFYTYRLSPKHYNDIHNGRQDINFITFNKSFNNLIYMYNGVVLPKHLFCLYYYIISCFQ